jgi:zinc protease
MTMKTIFHFSPILMMKRFIPLLLLMFVAATIPVSAQERWHELEFPELKSFNKPDVTTFSLRNGIRIYLLEDNELPLISASVLVRTGSILEPMDKVGLASMTGSVMRSGGSTKYPSSVLNPLLEDKAAVINTGIGFSSGSASMNALKEDFPTLLPIFVDVMMNPAFPEDRIEQAKRQSKTGISRRNDDPQGIAGREFDRLIYGNSVYAKQTEYATIDAITRQDLVDFHKKSFVGSNMMISVIGDFRTADMRRLIEQQFGAIPAGSPIELTFPDVEYNSGATVNLVDKKDAQQSVVFMGHEGGLRTDPDYAALQVMNQVLAGGFSGRLFQKVRTDLGLAYAVFGEYESPLNYKGSFYTGVMTKPETTAEAIDAIKTEIVRLQVEPVSDEELNRVKDQFLNSLVFRYTSLGSVLGERVSNEYNGVPADLFDRFIDDVKKVTPADVQRVAREKVRPNELQILVVSSKEALGDQLSKYGEVREIDITIPSPTAATTPVATAGDAEGAQWLDKMASALIADGTTFRGIEATGKISQGPMAFDAVTTMIFPSEFKTVILSPMGQIEQTLKDGVAIMKAGEQEQNLGAEGAAEIQLNLDTHYLGIVLKKGSLNASFEGMESVGGTEYAKISLPIGPGITVYVNAESGLPGRMAMTRFIPQMGAEATITTIYKDWKNVDGVQVSHTSDQLLDGNPGGGLIYTSVKLVK